MIKFRRPFDLQLSTKRLEIEFFTWGVEKLSVWYRRDSLIVAAWIFRLRVFWFPRGIKKGQG